MIGLEEIPVERLNRPYRPLRVKSRIPRSEPAGGQSPAGAEHAEHAAVWVRPSTAIRARTLSRGPGLRDPSRVLCRASRGASAEGPDPAAPSQFVNAHLTMR